MSDWDAGQWLLFFFAAALIGIGAGTIVGYIAVWLDVWIERKYRRLRRKGEW